MKSSAVYTTFPEKLVGCNGIERLPDAADEARIARHGAGKDWCGIHRQVNVCHSGARVIEDEAKRSPAFGIATPDISAEDRRRRRGSESISTHGLGRALARRGRAWARTGFRRR